jgi:hypothetical protein
MAASRGSFYATAGLGTLNMGRFRKDDDFSPEAEDTEALRMMLAYVEAECLRLGAIGAARYAAMAAELVPGPKHLAMPTSATGPSRAH